jgi:hypothetical protein
MTPAGPPKHEDEQPGRDAPALLAAWRASGAWRLDPARFHTLEAMARRMAGQAPAVLDRLQDSLSQGMAEYARRLAASPALASPEKTPRPRPAAPSVGHPLLAELNASIRQARANLAGSDAAGNELSSVQGFREAWSRVHAQEQVERAVARKPAQAGPLNSQVLALDALALMGEVSPGYLRRFMLHVDSLQWLEAAAAQARSRAEKPRAQRRPPTPKSQRPSRGRPA